MLAHSRGSLPMPVAEHQSNVHSLARRLRDGPAQDARILGVTIFSRRARHRWRPWHYNSYVSAKGQAKNCATRASRPMAKCSRSERILQKYRTANICPPRKKVVLLDSRKVDCRDETNELSFAYKPVHPTLLHPPLFATTIRPTKQASSAPLSNLCCEIKISKLRCVATERKTRQGTMSEWRVAAAVIVPVLIGIAATLLIPDVHSPEDIEVVYDAPYVEQFLAPKQGVIGDDYEGYRNHVYRVLSLTMHCLNDTEKEEFGSAVQVALAFHDMALWTDQQLNYLEPSWLRAQQELAGSAAGEEDQSELAKSWSEEEMQVIRDTIMYHHKVTPFDGPNSGVVNCARRSDWVDASFGIVHQGFAYKNIRKVMDAIPEAGFHKTLFGFATTRVHGKNVPKAFFELSKIFCW
ncbi:hypothetical protein FVE85_2459 [Porphyridium purpureum]|uniref:HD domain-containing protein n=1 Tax=Porphyridium purpureum TaxID=35688 RepID=A0A5J4YL79_PORPP|nr:hypothetical protein FVE85_2459 [Porphyridium purpureum]|eukprot:POR4540..scf291_13